MAITRALLIERVKRVTTIADDELVNQTLYDLVAEAVEMYSQDFPDELTVDVTGDGGRYYDIATLLTSWSESFSRIIEIQYPAPVLASDETPIYLEPDDWSDNYFEGSTRYLFLPNHTPSSTETMRIRYTTNYQLDTSNTYDIPPNDHSALVNLSASLVCRAIATQYARTTDSTIAADSVDHSGRSERFNTRATEFMNAYNDHKDRVLGDAHRDRPAGMFLSLDTSPDWPSGRQYLFRRGTPW